MSGSQAFIESYDRVEFTVRRGEAVSGRCLEVQGTARVLRLLEAVEKREPGAQAALIEEFCQLAELGNPRLSLAEILDEVLPHFLGLSGPQSPSPGPTPEAAPEPAPTGAGTT